MRVLFDHQVFSWQTYGGISRYIFEIARGLNGLGHSAVFPESFFSENVYLRAIPEVHAGSIAPFSFKGKKWLQERLGRSASRKAILREKPDVFHPTYFGDYFLKTALQQKVPFVLTIHDMIHEKYAHGSRGLFSLDARVVENKRLLAEKANAIIVVSDNTKQDLLHYIPSVDPAKIHTIYHGNSMPVDTARRPHILDLPERYLLFVGQRGQYKNFLWMVEQLATLILDEKDLYLVCAGGLPFAAGEAARLGALGLSDRILQPKIQSDADLSELYARACCFIFPSKYEGFGMPAIEAFACGCPTVLNAVSSLPEVGGDAALYFADNDGEGLRTSVHAVLHDGVLRDTIIKKGYERARQFTWQKSVGAHVRLYQTVIESA